MDPSFIERELNSLRRVAKNMQAELVRLEERIAELEYRTREPVAKTAESLPPISEPVTKPIDSQLSIDEPVTKTTESAPLIIKPTEPQTNAEALSKFAEYEVLEPMAESEAEGIAETPQPATPAGKKVPLIDTAEREPRQVKPFEKWDQWRREVEAAKQGSATARGGAERPRSKSPNWNLAALLQWLRPAAKSATADADVGETRTLNLEQRIGGVWFNRIGAVILFLASAFLVKISIDRGWITETARVLLAAGFGLLLVGVGEFFLYRKMRSFASGLLGCGIGVLYISAFGAHRYYELIEHSTASVLYTLITFVGAAIAVHANMLPVAILAVIGGYGTPLLLSTGKDQQVALLIYVLAVNVGFLITAWFRRWDVLRPLIWLGTLGLFGGWFWRFYTPMVMWRTAGFILTFYLLFHADLILNTRYLRIQIPRLAGFMLHVNNVAFFASIYFLMRRHVPEWMGLFAVATAAVQWVCAWRVCGGDERAANARRSLWLDGAAMLALAAPLQFDRYLVSISWSVQSAVTFWFCRKHADIWLRVKAFGVLLAAVVHLICYELHDVQLSSRIFEVGPFFANWVLACFICTGLCAYAGAAALAIRNVLSHDDRTLVIACVALGSLLLLGIFAHQWERYAATWAWLAIAALWTVVALRARPAFAVAIPLLFVTVGKFLAYDTVGGARGAWSALENMVFNRAVLCGVAIAALAYFMKPRIPARIRNAISEYTYFGAAQFFNLLIALVITWTATFELLRAFRFEESVRNQFTAPHLAVGVFFTALWAINGAVMCFINRARRVELVGYAVVVTLLAILRFLLLDTAQFALRRHWSDLSGIMTNRTFLVGLGVIVCALVARRELQKTAQSSGASIRWTGLSRAFTVIAAVLFTWASTFEVLRIFRFEELIREYFPKPFLAVGVFVTALWAVNAVAFWVIARRKLEELAVYALVLTGIVAFKVCSFDTLFAASEGTWNDLRGIAANRTFIVGMSVIATTLFAYWSSRRWAGVVPAAGGWQTIALALIVVCALLVTWVPTFEIVRVFRFEPWGLSFKDPKLTMHVVISCYWSLTAISLLMVGFVRDISVTRYTGIALFGLTIGKVFLVDMSRLDMVYRVVSFMVLGVLLILASFLYQRLRQEQKPVGPNV